MEGDGGLTTLYLAMTAVVVLLGAYLIYLHRAEQALRRELRDIGTLLTHRGGGPRPPTMPTPRGEADE